MMDLLGFRVFTFEGGEIDDDLTFERLPPEHRDLLMRVNGFVAYRGGFHVRGACRGPEWHALATVWDGDLSLHRCYPGVLPTDVPFAQDGLGDQFLLRGASVWRLWAENGDMEDLGLSLFAFLLGIQQAPYDFLDVQPLEVFESEGGKLRPGELLHADPPFIMQTGAEDEEILLKAVPAGDRIFSLMELAKFAPVEIPVEAGEVGVDLLELARLRSLKPH